MSAADPLARRAQMPLPKRPALNIRWPLDMPLGRRQATLARHDARLKLHEDGGLRPRLPLYRHIVRRHPAGERHQHATMISGLPPGPC